MVLVVVDVLGGVLGVVLVGVVLCCVVGWVLCVNCVVVVVLGCLKLGFIVYVVSVIDIVSVERWNVVFIGFFF